MEASTAQLVWGGLFTAGAAFEVWALRRKKKGATLSSVTRRVFRTDTRAGAVAFGILWVAFAAWFGVHIVWRVPFPGL